MQSNEKLQFILLVGKEIAVQQMFTVKQNWIKTLRSTFWCTIVIHFYHNFKLNQTLILADCHEELLSCCVYTLYMMLVFLNKNHKMHMKPFSEQLWRWSLYSKMTDTENTASDTSAWVCFVDETASASFGHESIWQNDYVIWPTFNLFI